MPVTIDDPRLFSAQCESLTPVKTVHENPWFSVRDRAGFFTVEYNQPQITVLPLVDRASAVLVRVKRPVLADVTLELPAGGALEGESPVQAACRELAEETGIRVSNLDRFDRLAPMCVSPRSPFLPHIFKVELTRDEFLKRGPHDDEIESVICLTLREALKKIADGEIYISLAVGVLARHCLTQGITG